MLSYSFQLEILSFPQAFHKLLHRTLFFPFLQFIHHIFSYFLWTATTYLLLFSKLWAKATEFTMWAYQYYWMNTIDNCLIVKNEFHALLNSLSTLDWIIIVHFDVLIIPIFYASIFDALSLFFINFFLSIIFSS